jgi:hypothetical protein
MQNSALRNLLIGGAFALLASSSLAHANTVLGSIWENDPTGAGNATIANIPVTPANVTFSVVSPFNFASGGAYTIGEFLTSAGASVITGAGELGNTLFL